MTRKLLTFCLGLTLLGACGETQEAEKAAAKEPAPVVEGNAANPDYKKGLALIGQNDCLTCHAIKDKITGPAYEEIAAKYAPAADTTIVRLAQTVIKGGSGHWGTVPMAPHPTITEEEAIQMVKYIMLLKK